MTLPHTASATAIVAVALLLLVAGLVAGVARALRGRWDLLIDHSRDLVRHALAGLLMLGTLAGTVWTFSNGQLSIDGIWESLISVGGIAAALELGVIYCGMYLGELDARITTTRRADTKQELLAKRRSVQHWFYATAGISCAANLIFRTQQLHSFWLALLPAAAPLLLVILFTVVLRPLPKDYQEIGRQSAQRGLVMLATQAQHVMMRSLRKIGAGHVLSQDEMAQLAMAVSFQRAYVSGEQQQALDQVIAAQTPRQLAAPAHGGSSGADGEWLTSADLQRLYALSERGAQLWMSQTPGRRKRPHSNSWEAPAATIYAAHGVPATIAPASAGSGSSRRRNRTMPQSAAEEPQSAANETPASAYTPPAPAVDLQFAVFEPQTSEDHTQKGV